MFLTYKCCPVSTIDFTACIQMIMMIIYVSIYIYFFVPCQICSCFRHYSISILHIPDIYICSAMASEYWPYIFTKLLHQALKLSKLLLCPSLHIYYDYCSAMDFAYSWNTAQRLDFNCIFINIAAHHFHCMPMIFCFRLV